MKEERGDRKLRKEGERWGQKNRTKRRKEGREEGRILRCQCYSVPWSSPCACVQPPRVWYQRKHEISVSMCCNKRVDHALSSSEPRTTVPWMCAQQYEVVVLCLLCRCCFPSSVKPLSDHSIAFTAPSAVLHLLLHLLSEPLLVACSCLSALFLNNREVFR